ncbi:MAG: signal recognition particle protein [Mycoplasmataceae bacterium]|nr:signal recognition particle protein [Mycoplasmataceae bacterium]
MAFNFLQNRIDKTIKKVQKQGQLTAENISEILQEIKISFLEADVNLEVVNDFIIRVEKKAIGQIVDFRKTSSQELLKIINQELVILFGGKTPTWNFKHPTTLMFVGLQGSGKTTSVAKVASFLSRKYAYKNPLLVGLDIYRPGAIDQLKQLAEENNFAFYGDYNEKNVSKITKKAQEIAKKNNHDLIIYDTAGRLQTDQKLMNELVSIKKIAQPSAIYFVADANSGQEILNVAKVFDEKLKLSAAIISKLDSDAKGGAALSLVSALNLPIQFIGTGEKVSDLDFFHPDRMAGRILGLGDIETLTEKVNELDEKNSQEKLMRKILSGRYDLEDLLYSMEQVSKIGSLGSVTKMLPGAKISNSQIESAEKKLIYYEVLINSMTGKEKRNPRLLKHPKRRTRILGGSGRTPQEYNELLRQFEKSAKQMKEMAKYIKMGKMPKMNNGFSGL